MRTMRTVSLVGLGDPDSLTAYPIDGRVGLLGDIPVALRAEGAALVGHGVGGQRVEIPARSIRQLWIHPEFESATGGRVRPALLVLDARHRILLRAPGLWGPGIPDVCQRLGLHKQPVVLTAISARRRVPTLTAADDCQRLRAQRARGRLGAAIASLVRAALCVGGGIGAVLLGLLLPGSVGDARTLVAAALGVIGAMAGVWFYHLGTRFSAGLIRWTVASRRSRSPAPAGQFLRVSGASPWNARAAAVVLAAAVPVLAVWGIVIEAVTVSGGGPLSHGAALGNIIAGALALLLAPLLARPAARRIRTLRHRVDDDLTSHLA